MCRVYSNLNLGIIGLTLSEFNFFRFVSMCISSNITQLAVKNFIAGEGCLVLIIHHLE